MKYRVNHEVNGVEDSVAVYEDWSFRDVYHDVLHTLKFKALLESASNGHARAIATIYKDTSYIAMISVVAINDDLLIMAIRRGDEYVTCTRMDW